MAGAGFAVYTMINLSIYIIDVAVFIIGLIIGSFLNSVIWRSSVNKSVAKGRSICPKCKHKLVTKDLVPLFSFLFLRAKCRYCKKPISWQYPLVELATGLVFVLILNFYFSNLILASFLIIISCFLIIIFVYDLKHYLILDQILWPAVALSAIFRVVEIAFINKNYFQFLDYTLAIAIGAGFFGILYLFSKGKWIGFGDIKLAILLGLILGWPNIIVGLFLSYLIGAIIGTSLIFLRKKKAKSEVPFAPFLITGTFLALFLGQTIINWYLSLLE